MGIFCFIILDFLLIEIKEIYSNFIYFEFIIRYCDVSLCVSAISVLIYLCLFRIILFLCADDTTMFGIRRKRKKIFYLTNILLIYKYLLLNF